MRFRFEGEGGNNFYLDDINLYEGNPSDDLVTGLYDGQQEIGLSLYPNPTESEISIDFNLNSNEKIQIDIVDVLGKNIRSLIINANEGKNSVFVETQSFAKGAYRVHMNGKTVSSSLPFVKL